eukprot:SAG31_NODE_975_length_10623_cov_7.244964_2_plen_60_part_00
MAHGNWAAVASTGTKFKFNLMYRVPGRTTTGLKFSSLAEYQSRTEARDFKNLSSILRIG